MVERRVLIETETSVMVRLIVTTAVVGTRRVILRVATFVCSRVVVFSRVLVRLLYCWTRHSLLDCRAWWPRNGLRDRYKICQSNRTQYLREIGGGGNHSFPRNYAVLVLQVICPVCYSREIVMYRKDVLVLVMTLVVVEMETLITTFVVGTRLMVGTREIAVVRTILIAVVGIKETTVTVQVDVVRSVIVLLIVVVGPGIVIFLPGSVIVLRPVWKN
jgi:hypothetical protein